MLAYTDSPIRYEGNPVCPECGQKLSPMSDSEMGRQGRRFWSLILVLSLPILTYIENLLVSAHLLPYSDAPEAMNFGNAYIVLEALLFLILIGFALVRWIKIPRDWVTWYAALSLLIFGLYQLAVFGAFEAKTLFGSDQAFVALLWLIIYAAFPLLVLSLICLVRVCLAKPQWQSVVASTSLVVSSLFLVVLSGVVGTAQISHSGFWLSGNRGGQPWIVMWSTLFLGLAFIAPIRFFVPDSRGQGVEEGTDGKLSSRTVTILITLIQLLCVLAFIQISLFVHEAK
jgi:hypothetical protein